MAKKILPLIQGKTVVVLSRSNSLHIYCVYDFEENEYGFWRNSNVSIHAHIDEHDYDRNDTDLRNEVRFHLQDHSNVDHINYISERLNHRKWFNTAYSNKEIDAAIAASDNELVSYVFRGENNLTVNRQVNDHEYIDNSLLESMTCN